MPGFYTQYYFSDKTKEYLPYAGQAAIALYPNSYRLGALGFDILQIDNLTTKLDYSYAYEFFDKASSLVYQSGSKVQLAYMLGLMSHYVLDSRMRPYIYYLLEKGVPKYFDDQKGFLTKSQITDSIDAHIQRKGLINKLDIKITKEESKEIEEIYDNVLPNVMDGYIISHPIAAILYKCKLPKIYPFELPVYDYMNRSKSSWLTVRNGEWQSDMSIDELLDKLIPIAVKMCEYLLMKIRSANPLDSQLFLLNYQGVLSQQMH